MPSRLVIILDKSSPLVPHGVVKYRVVERSPYSVKQKIVDLQGFLFLFSVSKLLRLYIFRAEISFLSRSEKSVYILADFKEQVARLFKIADIFFSEKFRRPEINRIGKIGKKLADNLL